MRNTVVLCLTLLLAPCVVAESFPLLAEDAAGLWGQADGTGCGNDIVVAAYLAAGASAALKIVPYNRAKQEVLSGKSLGCFGMAWSSELEGKVIFAKQPIYTNVSTIFALRDAKTKWKQLTDLPKGTRVGTVLGYEYPPEFEKLVAEGALTAIPSSTEVQSLKRLASGRLDAVIANLDDLKSAEYLLKQAEATGQVGVALTLARMGTYVGFSVADARTPAALAAFDKGMAIITRNGTLAAILERWKSKL